MKAKRMDHPNSGIKCEVQNCQYYMSGDYCCADKIEVQNKYATDSQETDCATFIPQAKW
jgi:hypothetical protein